MYDNTAQSRFELETEGLVSYADYRIDANILYITYVFVPPELRGTGVASELMTSVMLHARETALKIIPLCGYAASWIQRHKEYSDLLA